MILHEKQIGKALLSAMNSAKKRIWIAVPFIGTLNGIERIIGNTWQVNPNIDFKILTDIDFGFIKLDTYNAFKLATDNIRSLKGLHAKIYIVDDYVIISSANLTQTAFSKRYEIAYAFNGNKEVCAIFEKWWNLGRNIPENWLPSNESDDYEEQTSKSLHKLFDLPYQAIKIKEFKLLPEILNAYNHFSKLYQNNVKRVCPKLTLLQEIDVFFNYLYHEHDERPTKNILEVVSNSNKDKIQLLKKYHPSFVKYLSKSDHANKRLADIKFIHNCLNQKSINYILLEDVENVIRCFNCMNSRPSHIHGFIRENSLEMIKIEWGHLLFDEDTPLVDRMQRCKNNLRHFGKSSIQEFLSLYNPERFPMINTNSNSGMRFFGYNIPVY